MALHGFRQGGVQRLIFSILVVALVAVYLGLPSLQTPEESMRREFLEEGLVGPLDVFPSSRTFLDEVAHAFLEGQLDRELTRRKIVDEDILGLVSQVQRVLNLQRHEIWLYVDNISAKKAGEPHRLHQDTESALCPVAASAWLAIKDIGPDTSMLWGVKRSHRFPETIAELLRKDATLQSCSYNDVMCTLHAVQKYAEKVYEVDSTPIAPYVEHDYQYAIFEGGLAHASFSNVSAIRGQFFFAHQLCDIFKYHYRQYWDGSVSLPVVTGKVFKRPQDVIAHPPECSEEIHCFDLGDWVALPTPFESFKFLSLSVGQIPNCHFLCADQAEVQLMVVTSGIAELYATDTNAIYADAGKAIVSSIAAMRQIYLDEATIAANLKGFPISLASNISFQTAQAMIKERNLYRLRDAGVKTPEVLRYRSETQSSNPHDLPTSERYPAKVLLLRWTGSKEAISETASILLQNPPLNQLVSMSLVTSFLTLYSVRLDYARNMQIEFTEPDLGCGLVVIHVCPFETCSLLKLINGSGVTTILQPGEPKLLTSHSTITPGTRSPTSPLPTLIVIDAGFHEARSFSEDTCRPLYSVLNSFSIDRDRIVLASHNKLQPAYAFRSWGLSSGLLLSCGSFSAVSLSRQADLPLLPSSLQAHALKFTAQIGKDSSPSCLSLIARLKDRNGALLCTSNFDLGAKVIGQPFTFETPVFSCGPVMRQPVYVVDIMTLSGAAPCATVDFISLELIVLPNFRCESLEEENE